MHQKKDFSVRNFKNFLSEIASIPQLVCLQYMLYTLPLTFRKVSVCPSQPHFLCAALLVGKHTYYSSSSSNMTHFVCFD